MDGGISRRNFVVGAAAVAAVGTVAACGSDGGSKGLEPGTELVELEAIAAGSSQLVETDDGTEMVLTRISETEVKAFSAICTHQGCTVVADAAPLMCPCHGSTFDPETGQVITGPASKPLPEIEIEIVDGVVRAV